MEAKITIAGNQRDGYTCTLLLPTAWCGQFTESLKCEVADNILWSAWGKESKTEGYREWRGNFTYSEWAEECRAQVLQDLMKARACILMIRDTEEVTYCNLLTGEITKGVN